MSLWFKTVPIKRALRGNRSSRYAQFIHNCLAVYLHLDLPIGGKVFPSVMPEDVERIGASLPMSISRDKASGKTTPTTKPGSKGRMNSFKSFFFFCNTLNHVPLYLNNDSIP